MQGDRRAAEWFDTDAELFEDFPVVAHDGDFCRAQFDDFGDEEPLRFKVAAEHARTDFLVQHSLVQRVLVNEHQPVGRFDDEVRVVDLDGGERGRVDRATG